MQTAREYFHEANGTALFNVHGGTVVFLNGKVDSKLGRRMK